MSAFRLAAALLLTLAGCNARDGAGRFQLAHPSAKGKSGTFSITPQQFQRLRERLEPYRRQAVPVTERSADGLIGPACPRNAPFATDSGSGSVPVRWTGPGVDQHLAADLGCDYIRHASRNEDLLGVVQSLPLPSDW
ncbi:MAG: hypothetical protein ABIW83_02830 [Allosphingosinicella sp.]